jgi:hypothetical protein
MTNTFNSFASLCWPILDGQPYSLFITSNTLILPLRMESKELHDFPSFAGTAAGVRGGHHFDSMEEGLFGMGCTTLLGHQVEL